MPSSPIIPRLVFRTEALGKAADIHVQSGTRKPMLSAADTGQSGATPGAVREPPFCQDREKMPACPIPASRSGSFPGGSVPWPQVNRTKDRYARCDMLERLDGELNGAECSCVSSTQQLMRIP